MFLKEHLIPLNMMERRIKTGADCINELLEGGYESDIITTVYGTGGCGKTNLCLLALLSVVNEGKKVIYIDTEGNFSVARLKQLSSNYKEVLESVMLMKVIDFEQQKDIFERMDKLVTDEIGLVIVDSIATLYRLERDDNPDDATEINRLLGRQLHKIAKIARTKNVPVLVTNQVWQSFDDNNIRMVGGNLLRYASKCLIEIKKLKAGKRIATLKKHRSIAEEKEKMFEIVQDGIITLTPPRF